MAAALRIVEPVMFALVLVLAVALVPSVSAAASRVAPETVEKREAALRIQDTFRAHGIKPDNATAKPAAPSVGAEFHCDVSGQGPSATVPTSVHKLKIGDINVVAALGDSITAGFGAKSTNIFNVLSLPEWPGISWSIGGDDEFETQITLPNTLKKYNPNVYGASTGKTSAGKTDEDLRLNVAISGAKARGMPAQAHTLVEKLNADANVDINNDWVLVTVWIGGNDFCQWCSDGSGLSEPTKFAEFMEETLDILVQGIPHVYINMVSIVDVTELAGVGGLSCNLVQEVVCPCTRKGAETLYETEQLVKETSVLLRQMTMQSKFHTNQAEVQYQPFYELTHVPTDSKGNADMSYFAPDCFHFTTKAHAAAATALWNNLLQCPSEKYPEWHVNEDFDCPKHEYLPTNTNC